MKLWWDSRVQRVIIQSNKRDYPADWAKICEIFNKFGGRRTSAYRFEIRASLSEVERMC